ncbi:diacylglycerol/lipid kinase family protein, partial [Micromonospora lupini]|uniref:diacylglycerol/lipid kinase family protein n=1 Tax=Micromonospora lupini TaxID=285679 RepID=UPI003CD092E3
MPGPPSDGPVERTPSVGDSVDRVRDEAGPVAVLANPTAGRGRHRALLPRLLDGLATAGRPVRLLSASTPGEAEAACRSAVAGGVGALVAVGGDGTVHRAMQA